MSPGAHSTSSRRRHHTSRHNHHCRTGVPGTEARNRAHRCPGHCTLRPRSTPRTTLHSHPDRTPCYRMRRYTQTHTSPPDTNPVGTSRRIRHSRRHRTVSLGNSLHRQPHTDRLNCMFGRPRRFRRTRRSHHRRRVFQHSPPDSQPRKPRPGCRSGQISRPRTLHRSHHRRSSCPHNRRSSCPRTLQRYRTDLLDTHHSYFRSRRPRKSFPDTFRRTGMSPRHRRSLRLGTPHRSSRTRRLRTACSGMNSRVHHLCRTCTGRCRSARPSASNRNHIQRTSPRPSKSRTTSLRPRTATHSPRSSLHSLHSHHRTGKMQRRPMSRIDRSSCW
jgi:hypothetical protein